MSALLELNNVSRLYTNGEEDTVVLDQISLTINAGEMVAIIGASGSGKSTLMNILGCLDKPSSGEYKVAGQCVADMESDQLAALRREHFGFIFQRYHLMAHLTAEQNVEIPAIYAGKSTEQRARPCAINSPWFSRAYSLSAKSAFRRSTAKSQYCPRINEWRRSDPRR